MTDQGLLIWLNKARCDYDNLSVASVVLCYDETHHNDAYHNKGWRV